jgi:UV DNA damage endonuclease
MTLQVRHVARLPVGQRLLRLPSDLLPLYTHPVATPLYADPDLRALVEGGLSALGDAARAGGVRLSMHPSQHCVIASQTESAWRNGIADFEYHAEAMALMGYYGGWHPHGAHVNIHGGGRPHGVEGIRHGLGRLSRQARNLVTVENDEICYGLDVLLGLADDLPIVFDIHHHWIHSEGEYLMPGDPRIAAIRASWRGTRPVAHVSVSREDLLPGHDPRTLPDFEALVASGLRPRHLRAHSDMMWNDALNAIVAGHLAWADFEVEAKSKNLASADIAARVGFAETAIAA